jgi:hypothetical protein
MELEECCKTCINDGKPDTCFICIELEFGTDCYEPNEKLLLRKKIKNKIKKCLK